MKINTRLPFTLLAVLALTFNSCKRKHTCECVSTSPSTLSASGPSTETFPVKETKSNAKTICENLSIPLDSYGNETKCTLK